MIYIYMTYGIKINGLEYKRINNAEIASLDYSRSTLYYY